MIDCVCVIVIKYKTFTCVVCVCQYVLCVCAAAYQLSIYRQIRHLCVFAAFGAEASTTIICSDTVAVMIILKYIYK